MSTLFFRLKLFFMLTRLWLRASGVPNGESFFLSSGLWSWPQILARARPDVRLGANDFLISWPSPAQEFWNFYLKLWQNFLMVWKLQILTFCLKAFSDKKLFLDLSRVSAKGIFIFWLAPAELGWSGTRRHGWWTSLIDVHMTRKLLHFYDLQILAFQ